MKPTDVKQVPYMLLSDLAVHWLEEKRKRFQETNFLIVTLFHTYLFGKVTTLNNENISAKKVISWSVIMVI